MSGCRKKPLNLTLGSFALVCTYASIFWMFVYVLCCSRLKLEHQRRDWLRRPRCSPVRSSLKLCICVGRDVLNSTCSIGGTAVALSFSSVQFNLFNSFKRKSQWKASVQRWVLSPARNWLRLMDGEQRWSGSEFHQTTGAAMKKLCLPSLAVLLCGTNRLPCSADDHCRCTVEHCIAVVNSVSDKRSSECLPGIGRERTLDTS